MHRKYSLSIIHYTFAIILVMAMASCRSSKKATQGDDIATSTTSQVSTKPSTEEKTVAAVIANQQTAKGLHGRVGLKLRYGSSSASASGQIKMKRDECILVTVMALGIMEVGRMELTPQHLVVLDRVNKQYLQVGWSEVPELANAGVDFSTFQALFWNELFVPGIKGTPAATDFEVKPEVNGIRLTPKAARANTKKLAANFLVGTSTSLVQQTNVVPTDGQSRMNFQCTYSDWGKLGGKKFPKEMFLNVNEGSKNYSLTLSHSNLQTDETLDISPTRVPTGYKRVTLEQIVKMLAK